MHCTFKAQRADRPVSGLKWSLELWSVCFTKWMCPRSAPRMGFHFNWHSPTSIRQHDRHGDGDCWGEPYTHAASYGGGSYLFMWDSDRLKMFMLSFSRLWQAPNRSVWARWFLVCVLYICLCAGVCGCRVRTPAIHWSRAFAVKSGLCLPDLLLSPSFLLSFPDTRLWQILSVAPVGK